MIDSFYLRLFQPYFRFTHVHLNFDNIVFKSAYFRSSQTDRGLNYNLGFVPVLIVIDIMTYQAPQSIPADRRFRAVRIKNTHPEISGF